MRFESSQRVAGFRKAVAVTRVTARVVWLALREYRNPLRAIRAIGRLRSNLRDWASTVPGRKRSWTSLTCVRSSGRLFWDLSVPGFPSRAFDRCVTAELERVDPQGRPTILRAAIVAITRRCGLECEHCFEWDTLNQAEALSLPDLREIVGRVRQRGAVQIFFSGGEPLQRFRDLLALAGEVSPDTDVWILTAGQGLTPDKAGRLAAAGVTGVALSLDHWDPAAHDSFRGRDGAFDAVTRAAAHAREAGLLVALSLCPTRAFVTAENLERYGETARRLGAAFIQIMEPRSMGHYAGRAVELQPAHQRVLEEFSDRLNADSSADHMPNVHYLDWSRRTYGCGGGRRFVYIDTAGNLHACPFCRTSAVPALGHDIGTALSVLQAAGCAAESCSAHPVAKVAS
jgi:MoaA/NifB/PqqE/SkfB family radical SAM enzyme